MRGEWRGEERREKARSEEVKGEEWRKEERGRSVRGGGRRRWEGSRAEIRGEENANTRGDD